MLQAQVEALLRLQRTAASFKASLRAERAASEALE
jgi:hypothetical protein